MIVEEKREIYLDYSILNAFGECPENERLGYEIGYRILERSSALDFGHAFHAAVAAYYDTKANGWFDAQHNWHFFDAPRSPSLEARAAFLRDLKIEGATLPVSMDSDDRRTVERGLALVEAYIHRWRNEPYVNLIIDGRPSTEITFKFWLTKFHAPNGVVYDVYYVGTIDRLMMNIATGRPLIFETKTTTQALPVYIQQCKPNHQITGYFKEARQLLPEVMECVWDCIFVSSRKADMAAALSDENRFMMWGVDVNKDFARQTTTRSATDVAEWMLDIETAAQDYCRWVFSGAARWQRRTSACHKYRGCQFRRVCMVNGDQGTLDTFYEIKPWNPLKKIRETND